MKLFYFLCISVFANTLLADTFQLTIGSQGNEYGTHMVETTDKSYLIVGYTSGGHITNDDGLVVKVGQNGKVIWSKNIGTKGTDKLYGCIEMNNHYYVVGNSTSSLFKGGQDAWITKLNTKGEIIWSKTFGGKGDDGFYKLVKLNGNRLAICGYSGGNGEQYAYLYLVKLNENGDVFWEKKYGSGLESTQTNSARNMTLTPAGQIVLTGYTYCFGAGIHDAIVVNIDTATGDRNWTKSFGSPKEDGLNSIVNTNDGNLVCSGNARLDGSINTKYWVIKMNQIGDTIWQKSYFINPSKSYSGYIAKAEDDGFIAAFNESNTTGYLSCYITRLNPNGNALWTKVFDGVNFEQFNAIISTSDGGYMALGQTNSLGSGGFDIFLVKLDKDGNMDQCCIKSSTIASITNRVIHSKQTQIILDLNSSSEVSSLISHFQINEMSQCAPKVAPVTIHASVCKGSSYKLPDGTSSDQAGTYIVNYKSVGGCDSSIITILEIKNLPELSLRDTSMCEFNSDTVRLYAGDFVTYKWQPNGENAHEIKVTKPGKYSVTVTNSSNCSKTASTQIKSNCTPTLFVPNAFTPDGDNINDKFGASGVSVEKYQMLIYNRWGEKLFESKDILDTWDGNYLNIPVPQGVYIFVIYAQGINFKSYYKKGTITLLR